MFFNLAWRNSKRSRSENLIYFLTMVTAVATFYIVLSLGEQDVIRFLGEIESDAVDRLLTNGTRARLILFGILLAMVSVATEPFSAGETYMIWCIAGIVCGITGIVMTFMKE